MLIKIFLFIFVFNIAPVFTPPTWIMLSYFSVIYHPAGLALAAVGALAATLGRLALAQLSHVIIRNRFISQRTKTNLDTIGKELENRQGLTFGLFLFYAFSPFPSNQLFLAYGLTGLKISRVAVPFFIGRFCSYLFWIVTASKLAHELAAKIFISGGFLKTYFIAVQILTLVVVYLFSKIDWRKLLTQKKLAWIK